MEQRDLLSVSPLGGPDIGSGPTPSSAFADILSPEPIKIGMVYYENYVDSDSGGDKFELSWLGGAPGTQLTQVTIDTDKFGDGLTIGDAFFDTDPGGLGTSGAVPFSFTSNTGVTPLSVSVDDGGTLLTMTFADFDPGETVTFEVDVDEQGFANSNAVCEGAEFEGSILSAQFEAPHFFMTPGESIFFDTYVLDPALGLPPDEYVDMQVSEVSEEVRTAGTEMILTQDPLPASLSGTVYEDLELNNQLDPVDLGIANVEVTLLRYENGQFSQIATTVTDALGRYSFQELDPGSYTVVETQPMKPAHPVDYFSVGASSGWVGLDMRGFVSSPDQIDNIILLGGDEGVRYDFAEAAPAQLSGHVYEDLNNDGNFNTDPNLGTVEPGIGGAIIQVTQLDAQGNPIRSFDTFTDPNGYWSTGELEPGFYQVSEITPPGYFDGLDAAGTAGGIAQNPGDLITDIWLGSRQNGLNYDFGELVPASLSGNVFEDVNGDGLLGNGDLPIDNVMLELVSADGTFTDYAFTDSNGHYQFNDLMPGEYRINETQPAGFLDAEDHVGSHGGALLAPDSITQIVLQQTDTATGYNFLEVKPSSISGRVLVDIDVDGNVSAGDTPISGVTVELLDMQGIVLETTTTNVAGEYQFNDIVPGVYAIREVQPTGYFDGNDIVGSEGGYLMPPDSMTDIVITSGTVAYNYDFLELEPVSVSGHVYVDANQNGIFDSTETTISGVTLELLDEMGTPTGRTVLTDISGYYRFDDLAPQRFYGIQETQPIGYFDGIDAAGSLGGLAMNPGDRIIDIFTIPGNHGINYDFGELEPASIAGRVHGDLNGDCVRQKDEPLLEGVTIHLTDANGDIIGTTTTDARGEYQFIGLEPGTYGIEEIQPSDYLQGMTWVGSEGGDVVRLDLIGNVDLGSGVDAINYNFCEAVPATISGYVFQDGEALLLEEDAPIPAVSLFSDGQFTSDDTPLVGVRLILIAEDGMPVTDADGNHRIAVTNSSGYYEFDMLYEGTYSVLQEQPDGYIDGIDTPGDPYSIAANEDSPVSPMTMLQLQLGVNAQAINTMSTDVTQDAIFRIRVSPGDHATSYNFSEVRVNRIPDTPPGPGPDPNPVPTPDFPDLPAPGAPVQPEFALTYVPGIDQTVRTTGFGGGGAARRYSWHLSVINAGSPRMDTAYRDTIGMQTVSNIMNPYFDPMLWSGQDMRAGRWQFDGISELAMQDYLFGLEYATPVTGDFNGDGADEVAVFIEGIWFIDLNGNGVWDEGDLWAKLGDGEDLPVAGDWDGDGKDDIGVFGPSWMGDTRALKTEPGLPDVMNDRIASRPKNMPPMLHEAPDAQRSMKQTAQGTVRDDVIDHTFRYGSEGDIGIAGDWNGDGITNIGLYRNGTWYLDTNGDGLWNTDDEYFENVGTKHDIPVVGDFNADGVDDIGLFRDGKWHLDINADRLLDNTDQRFELGQTGDRPVTGDFNGDGIEDFAVYRNAQQGPSSDGPIDQQASEGENTLR